MTSRAGSTQAERRLAASAPAVRWISIDLPRSAWAAGGGPLRDLFREGRQVVTDCAEGFDLPAQQSRAQRCSEGGSGCNAQRIPRGYEGGRLLWAVQSIEGRRQCTSRQPGGSTRHGRPCRRERAQGNDLTAIDRQRQQQDER